METLLSKQEITAKLKEAGLGFVKVNVDSYTDKTHKDWNGKTSKGIRGGSIGPMTSTNAHKNHDRAAEDNLIEKIGSQFLTERNSIGLTFEIPFSATHKRTLSFTWSYYPTNAASKNLDEGYQTNWLTMSSKDSKI